MIYIDADKLEALLTPKLLVDAIREMFQRGADVPLRHHYTLPHSQGEGTMLLMPAWCEDTYSGVKIVSVHPSNAAQGLPSIFGSYILMEQATGQPLAYLDGRMLTLLRTAAASVLAATYLARKESKSLLMVGTGNLAPYVVKTYSALFALDSISIWGRTHEKAMLLAAQLSENGLPATAVTDLPASAAAADIISCATLSHTPVVPGHSLAPGSHLDLIGGFTPAMRETDDDAVKRSSLFVDTREGALHESGDIVQPIKDGVIGEDDILADLYDLTRGIHQGRLADNEITLFKSVGTALEDLAAAGLAYRLYHRA